MIIDAIFTIYNIAYKNYNENKNIVLKNVDNIIESIIMKIEKIFCGSIKNELMIIKYLFGLLNKLCSIEYFINKISFSKYHQLFLVLISSSINKEIKNICENNVGDINEGKNIVDDYNIIKSINSCITQLINHFDITNNILALIIIIKNNRINNKEIVEYSIRYLDLVIKQIKEKYLDLKINIIFNKIENLLDEIEKKKEKKIAEINNSLSIDDSISLLMKDLVIEITLHRKEYCLKYQKNIKNKNILNWIQDGIKMKNVNKDNNNDFKKGFLFEGETFYPKVDDKDKTNQNNNNNDSKINYTPEERIERNFENIKKKWKIIQKNE
jgi:hypothetical protein